MKENDNTNEYSIDFDKEKINTMQFKCPSCGNNLEFDPTTQKLKCPYCGTEKEIGDVDLVVENSFTPGSFEVEENEDVEIYRCSNCGAVSEKVKDGIAFACPYCKKTNVVLEEDIKGIKPTGIIPFTIDKKTIVEKAKSWIKSRFFAPRKIKKQDFNSVISGYYSPTWTFDSGTYSIYKGRIGNYYTVTVGTGKNRHTETRIRWRNVSGNHSKDFDDMLVYAGKQMNDKEFNKLSVFDTNHAKIYEKKYLAGYYAMHYSKNVDEAFSVAKDKMTKEIEKEIISKHHADVVDYMHINTSYFRTTYKYILLPFYFGNFDYNQKSYHFIANGVSGKIYGKYPKSPIKITLTVLLGLGIVALLIYLFMMYNGNI